jgi:hypothetical protein
MEGNMQSSHTAIVRKLVDRFGDDFRKVHDVAVRIAKAGRDGGPVSLAIETSHALEEAIYAPLDGQGMRDLQAGRWFYFVPPKGRTFQDVVTEALDSARLTVDVAVWLYENATGAPLMARCPHTAAVLSVCADPHLQERARAWIAENGVSRIWWLPMPGFGAVMRAAAIAGPNGPDDALPALAGDLLNFKEA